MTVAVTTRLYDLAYTLLTGVQTVFATNGISLPDRQYLTQSDESFDCESLMVSLTGSTPGQPGAFSDGIIKGNQPYFASATFRVTLLRCISVLQEDGSPPSVDALDDDAVTLMTDGWVLFDGLRQAQAAGDLFGGGCDAVSIGPLTPVQNQGGLGGWQLIVTVGL